MLLPPPPTTTSALADRAKAHQQEKKQGWKRRRRFHDFFRVVVVSLLSHLVIISIITMLKNNNALRSNYCYVGGKERKKIILFINLKWKGHEIWKKRHVSRVKNYVPRCVCLVTPTFHLCFIFYSVTRYLPPPLHAGHIPPHHLLF